MSQVALEHVSKTYPNGVQAVRDLNLSIGDGELVVLLGPSGCGKTTTLRLIAGLERPTGGNISIGGQIADALPPRKRNVAMVFQRPTVYPHLNVRANIAFGLRLQQKGWLTRLALRWLRPDTYRRLSQQQKDLADQVDRAA